MCPSFRRNNWLPSVGLNTNRTVQLVPLFVDLNHQPFSVCSRTHRRERPGLGRIGALLGYVFQTPHGLVPRRVPVLKYSSMSTDPNDPLTVIEQAFARIAECPGFCGAVLATSDGLVLACTGTLQGDVAAACMAASFHSMCDQLSKQCANVRHRRSCCGATIGSGTKSVCPHPISFLRCLSNTNIQARSAWQFATNLMFFRWHCCICKKPDSDTHLSIFRDVLISLTRFRTISIVI